MPLDPSDIPSPFQHEDGRLDGGEPSLTSKLWDLLISSPRGLPLTQIGQESGKEEQDIEAVLEHNDYFIKLESGYWALSIFKPLRWGVAGVGKISGACRRMHDAFAASQSPAASCLSKLQLLKPTCIVEVLLSTSHPTPTTCGTPCRLHHASSRPAGHCHFLDVEEEIRAAWRADDFITAAAFLPGTQLVAAAASSSLDKAQEFAKRHGFKRAHGSYRDLAGDPDVEVVYVGNVHPQHRVWYPQSG